MLARQKIKQNKSKQKSDVYNQEFITLNIEQTRNHHPSHHYMDLLLIKCCRQVLDIQLFSYQPIISSGLNQHEEVNTKNNTNEKRKYSKWFKAKVQTSTNLVVKFGK